MLNRGVGLIRDLVLEDQSLTKVQDLDQENQNWRTNVKQRCIGLIRELELEDQYSTKVENLQRIRIGGPMFNKGGGLILREFEFKDQS